MHGLLHIIPSVILHNLVYIIMTYSTSHVGVDGPNGNSLLTLTYVQLNNLMFVLY